MVFAQTIGRILSSWRDGIARGLCSLGVPPNLITAVGCAFTIIAGVALAYGRPHLAFALIFLSSAMDMLDGAVARISDRKTPFGGVFDSVVDRFADGAVFTGIMVFYAGRGEIRNLIAASLAMIGAFATSYARARAECVVDECKAGFWERGERMVLIMIALLFNRLTTAMYVLAVFTNWTAIHRIYYAWVKLSKKPAPEEQIEGIPLHRIEGAIYDVIFWKYDRLSWQYDVAVVVYIAALLLIKV